MPTDSYLVVETEPIPNSMPDETPREEKRPFFLYDENGVFLRDYRAGRAYVSPGRYIIVSKVKSEHRQVQVVVKEGHTTRITLQDLKAGHLRVKNGP